MIYRNAVLADIPAILALQKKYHIATISDADKPDGFVTTLFTQGQFEELIAGENGIALASDEGRIIAYVMAASWAFWSKWPLFTYMIADLPNMEYMGLTLSAENSYQYGPICIEKAYRGTEVLKGIFDFSRAQMHERYPILITFINHTNSRSYEAHVRKLGLTVIKSFTFSQNNYYALGYDTSREVR
ncbi:MAG: GNAT family acetyltransferase [Clostridiaceae bacterium]